MQDGAAPAYWEPRRPGIIRAATEYALLLADDHVRFARAQHEWRVMCVPRSYLHRSWPLQLAALCSTCVAVAGESGVAVASLATERWRVFGMSAAARLAFRALYLQWISEEALLVVCNTLAADEIDDDDSPTVTIVILRSDLREVLFRRDVHTPGPRTALWGCTVLADEAASGGCYFHSRSTGNYGLPSHMSVVLGVARCLVFVALHTGSTAASSAAAVAAPLALRETARHVLDLPPSDHLASEPAGLSALLVESRRDHVPIVCKGGERAGGGGEQHSGRIEVVVAMRDASAYAFTLPTLALAPSSDPTVLPIRLPAGSAPRSWHIAGSLWTHDADGVHEWSLAPQQASTAGVSAAAPRRQQLRLPACSNAWPLTVIPRLQAALVATQLPVSRVTSSLAPGICMLPLAEAHGRPRVRVRLLVGSHRVRARILARAVLAW